MFSFSLKAFSIRVNSLGGSSLFVPSMSSAFNRLATFSYMVFPFAVTDRDERRLSELSDIFVTSPKARRELTARLTMVLSMGVMAVTCAAVRPGSSAMAARTRHWLRFSSASVLTTLSV